MIHNKSVYKLPGPIGIFVNRFQDQIMLCYAMYVPPAYSQVSDCVLSGRRTYPNCLLIVQSVIMNAYTYYYAHYYVVVDLKKNK